MEKKSCLIYTLLDLGCFLGIFFSIYYIIITLPYFPESILMAFALGLSAFTCAFMSVLLSFLIIAKFFRYLFIYEKGIEIRTLSLIPFTNELQYIPFDEIADIEIKEHNNIPYIIYIHCKDQQLHELDKYDVIELRYVIDLISDVKGKRFTS